MRRLFIIALFAITPLLAGASWQTDKEWSYRGHHDYNITFTTHNGRYNTASFKISTRLKHPNAHAYVRLSHELWPGDYLKIRDKKSVGAMMDDYGEIDLEYTVPLSEMLKPYDSRDYPTGIFVIEITDDHSTHTYFVAYERDKRYIKFRGSALFCNIEKYWGNWEYELVPEHDKEQYCR